MEKSRPRKPMTSRRPVPRTKRASGSCITLKKYLLELVRRYFNLEYRFYDSPIHYQGQGVYYDTLWYCAYGSISRITLLKVVSTWPDIPILIYPFKYEAQLCSKIPSLFLRSKTYISYKSLDQLESQHLPGIFSVIVRINGRLYNFWGLRKLWLQPWYCVIENGKGENIMKSTTASTEIRFFDMHWSTVCHWYDFLVMTLINMTFSNSMHRIPVLNFVIVLLLYRDELFPKDIGSMWINAYHFWWNLTTFKWEIVTFYYNIRGNSLKLNCISENRPLLIQFRKFWAFEKSPMSIAAINKGDLTTICEKLKLSDFNVDWFF